MKKKLFGIFICTLVLFSILPTVAGVNLEKLSVESLLLKKDNNNPTGGFEFLLIYGRIIYLGKEVHNNYTYYNITPIRLSMRQIVWDPGYGFVINLIVITDDKPTLIPKDFLEHGFVGKNFMFVWHYEAI